MYILEQVPDRSRNVQQVPRTGKEDRAITEIGCRDDQLTIDSINNLIKKTEAKKAALHPEQQKG